MGLRGASQGSEPSLLKLGTLTFPTNLVLQSQKENKAAWGYQELWKSRSREYELLSTVQRLQ